MSSCTVSPPSPTFQRESGQTHNSLLILQCDSGHLDGDLIACARYRIYDERARSLMQNSIQGREGSTHVLFIIHLPQQATGSSFVGFQGDPWISTHIDDLRPAEGTLPTLNEALGATISELFLGQPNHTEAQEDMEVSTVGGGEEMPLPKDQWMAPHESREDEEPEAMDTEQPTTQFIPGVLKDEMPPSSDHEDEEVSSEPEAMAIEGPTEQVPLEVSSPKAASIGRGGYYRRLHGCIHAAASKLQDSEKNKKRATKRVEILVELIPREPTLHVGKCETLTIKGYCEMVLRQVH